MEIQGKVVVGCPLDKEILWVRVRVLEYISTFAFDII